MPTKKPFTVYKSYRDLPDNQDYSLVANIEVTPQQAKKKLGKPTVDNTGKIGESTMYEWQIEFPDGRVVTFYDYKLSPLYEPEDFGFALDDENGDRRYYDGGELVKLPTKVYQEFDRTIIPFSVGGTSKEDAQLVREALGLAKPNLLAAMQSRVAPASAKKASKRERAWPKHLPKPDASLGGLAGDLGRSFSEAVARRIADLVEGGKAYPNERQVTLTFTRDKPDYVPADADWRAHTLELVVDTIVPSNRIIVRDVKKGAGMAVIYDSKQAAMMSATQAAQAILRNVYARVGRSQSGKPKKKNGTRPQRVSVSTYLRNVFGV
jgi:hypothetical protein